MIRNYAPIFDALTERQRNIMGRLAVDDATALSDRSTVDELIERGLLRQALDETDNVSTMAMPTAVHMAWCHWYSEHMPAEDRAALEEAERAPAVLARAEAEPPPPVPPNAGADVPRRRGRGRGRPRNRGRKAKP